MTATNHTENYNLSQSVGTDRPKWLVDYNGDMAKIDTQLKQNADDIASATEGGLTSVSHTADLTGNGTAGMPLGVMQGGLLSNSKPADTVNIDSIDDHDINTFAQVNNSSSGNMPVPNVEGLCFCYRASASAIVEVIFSNDQDANIYIRRNYNGAWRPWRTVAMQEKLANLISRIEALESKVGQLTTDASPSTTGLTAAKLDTQYSDNYNIVREGTPTRNAESEETSNE